MYDRYIGIAYFKMGDYCGRLVDTGVVICDWFGLVIYRLLVLMLFFVASAYV